MSGVVSSSSTLITQYVARSLSPPMLLPRRFWYLIVSSVTSAVPPTFIMSLSSSTYPALVGSVSVGSISIFTVYGDSALALTSPSTRVFTSESDSAMPNASPATPSSPVPDSASASVSISLVARRFAVCPASTTAPGASVTCDTDCALLTASDAENPARPFPVSVEMLAFASAVESNAAAAPEMICAPVLTLTIAVDLADAYPTLIRPLDALPVASVTAVA